MPLSPLPVDRILPDLLEALRARSGEDPERARSAVLRAPTGSGKTTRVPPTLLDGGLAGGGRVLVTEPRRLAARAAARRIAAERGVALGGEVGYQVRFDRRAGDDTRLLVVTEGILVQRLQGDPLLDGVGAIVFDEVHERSLALDLALAMARRVQREVRPDLTLVAMSATFDPGPVARFLGDAAVLEAEGRLHPVEIHHLPSPEADARSGRDRRALARAIAAATGRALEETAGDLLVFLPGVGEIRAAEEALEGLARRQGLDTVPLYGALPPERQDAALSPAADGRRRVVLATNVAESSVTVPGVTGVIDSGLERSLRFDPATGLDRLELVRISRASADQRAGRAGRLAPGIALRLWPEIEHRALPAETPAEILRVDLSGAALELLAWGETDLTAFPWFEAPPADTLASAVATLRRLGAVEAARGERDAPLTDLRLTDLRLTDLQLTATGRTLARLPVHPRLARLLVEGHRRGVLREAALVAAMLAERPPFGRPDRDGPAIPTSRSDLLDRLEVLEAFERTNREPWDSPLGPLRQGAARFVLQARDRLVQLTESALGRSPRKERLDPDEREEALLRAVFAAHADRLVRRRAPGDDRGVMVGGRGVRLARESAVREAELVVAVEIGDAHQGRERSEALVYLASAVEPAWLPESGLVTERRVLYDPDRDRVMAREERRFEDLVLAEHETGAVEPEEALAALTEAAAAHPETALGLGRPELAGWLHRVAFLRREMPELDLPEIGPETVLEMLPAMASARRRGPRSLADLARLPVADWLRGLLDHRQLQALEDHAPERLEVPSGSHIRLAWEGDGPPVLAVRIQELFGLETTPTVAAGRVPVLLHLLAPNYRPQQITDDLPGFWDRTYTAVRKELQGRYPKHAWPEDPRKALPERRPRRRPR